MAKSLHIRSGHPTVAAMPQTSQFRPDVAAVLAKNLGRLSHVKHTARTRQSRGGRLGRFDALKEIKNSVYQNQWVEKSAGQMAEAFERLALLDHAPDDDDFHILFLAVSEFHATCMVHRVANSTWHLAKQPIISMIRDASAWFEELAGAHPGEYTETYSSMVKTFCDQLMGPRFDIVR